MLPHWTAVLLVIAVAVQDKPQKLSKYRVGIGVSESRGLYTPDPNYTKEAIAKGIKGTVVLVVRVDENGCIREPIVIRSLGYGLDEEALRVVRYWRFKPTIRSGRPITTKVSIEMNFDPVMLPGNPVKATDKPCGKR